MAEWTISRLTRFTFPFWYFKATSRVNDNLKLLRAVFEKIILLTERNVYTSYMQNIETLTVAYYLRIDSYFFVRKLSINARRRFENSVKGDINDFSALISCQSQHLDKRCTAFEAVPKPRAKHKLDSYLFL